MGSWGVAIFSDDLAEDVRLAYREQLEKGKTGPEATDQVLHDMVAIADDVEEGPVFWFALAATQARLGRLEDRVRQAALQAIDAGTDLRRWESEDSKLATKRRAVLEKLRAELTGPPKPLVRVRPYRPLTTPYVPGDVLAGHLDDGRQVILRIMGIHSSGRGDRLPIIEVLDWVGTELPALQEMAALPRAPKRYPAEPDLHVAVRPKPAGGWLSLAGRIARDDPQPGSLELSFCTWDTVLWYAQQAVDRAPVR